MSAHVSRLFLTTLALWLTGCGATLQRPAPTAVVPVSGQAARTAVIRKQLQVVCPQPVSPDALDRGAAYIDLHPDAAPVLSPFVREDEETRSCRGLSKGTP